MPGGGLNSIRPTLLSVLRMVVGFLFMLHGTQKLFAFPGPGQTVPLMSQMGVAGMLETFGGLLILVGLFTRPVAFVLSGEMAVAYFQAHFPRNFWPTLNGGEASALFCFVFLYFFAAGAGPISLDRMLRHRKG